MGIDPSEPQFKCYYCSKMVREAFNHKTPDGKPITCCRLCLEKEVAEIINERHKSEGNVRRYNEARKTVNNYRKYYEKDPVKAKPLP